MRAILAIMALCLSLVGTGQIQEFPATELREDLTFLKESIEKYNPALYKYNHKGKFDDLFKEIYASINRPLTRLEFFKAVSLLTASANEGHFVLGGAGNGATKIYRGFLDGTFKYLPITLTFLQNRAYITGNFSADPVLQPGWEVLEINNEKISAIIERLLPFIPADGDILTAKYYRLNKNFPHLYYWYIDQPANFKLKVLPPGSLPAVNLSIAATSRDTIVSRSELRYNESHKPKEGIDEFYELTLEGNLAILKLKTFSHLLIDKYQIDARKLYKSIFRKLADKNIENLILDLRDNGGGNREFAQRIVPYLLRRKEKGNLYQTMGPAGNVKTYPMPNPNPDAFKGNVYVLINGGSFSNGSVVACFAKEFSGAVIIGQESASRYEGFAAGSYEYIHLPNTLIQVQIPRDWIKYGHKNRQGTFNRGVMPDHLIHYSIEDILSEKDKEMEKAMELINGS